MDHSHMQHGLDGVSQNSSKSISIDEAARVVRYFRLLLFNWYSLFMSAFWLCKANECIEMYVVASSLVDAFLLKVSKT